jgi:hypothetical protein
MAASADMGDQSLWAVGVLTESIYQLNQGKKQYWLKKLLSS